MSLAYICLEWPLIDIYITNINIKKKSAAYVCHRPECITNALCVRGKQTRHTTCFVTLCNQACLKEKRILSGTNIKKKCQTKGRGEA